MSFFHWKIFPLEYKTCSLLIVGDNEEKIKKISNLFPDIDKIVREIDDIKDISSSNNKSIILNLNKIFSVNKQYKISKVIIDSLDKNHSLMTKSFPNPTHILAYGNKDNIPEVIYDNFDYIVFLNITDSTHYLATRNAKQIGNVSNENSILIDNTSCNDVINVVHI
jgi:hypothetical protein